MRLFTLLVLCCFAFTLAAQDRIAGETIIDRLNKGESIALTNVVITGDLDFTQLADRETENNGRWNDQKAIRTHVRKTLSFNSCTFKGDVIGYYSPQNRWGMSNKNEPLVNTDFHEKVAFINCTFEEAVLFKYSHFKEMATFKNAEFQEKANFKYTNFQEAANFSGAKFNRLANFKYTDFDEGPNFANAYFDGDADFKYTKFTSGSSLAGAIFRSDADFKYTQFHENTDLDGVDFGRRGDFKYTKKGGRSYRPGR